MENTCKQLEYRTNTLQSTILSCGHVAGLTRSVLNVACMQVCVTRLHNVITLQDPTLYLTGVQKSAFQSRLSNPQRDQTPMHRSAHSSTILQIPAIANQDLLST